MLGLLCRGSGYGCVADGPPLAHDAVAVALGGDAAPAGVRVSGQGGAAAGAGVAGASAVVP
ncbi:hypothetical protein [Streptomyces albus]